MKLLTLSDLKHFWTNAVQKIPIKISDLRDDVALGTHIADTDIHVTSSDKTSWNTVTSKANDSDVVHKTGDETIAGVKTFSDDTYIKSLNFTSEVASQSSSGGSTLPLIATVTYTGQTESKSARINLRISANGTKTFYPHENNQYSLGTASKKWSEVRAYQYYYGSSDIEFSDKFVTTDSTQTISGVKSFSNDTYITSLNFTNNVASPSSSGSSIMPIINTVTYTSGDTSVVARLNFRVTADGTKSLYPHENNQYYLGLQSRKWKEIHATTYYYGSSDAEFSTKFVTSDTAQTITENKTFTKNVKVKNEDVTRGSTTDSGTKAISFTDSSDNELVSISTNKVSNGSTALVFKASSTDNTDALISSSFQFFIAKSGAKVINPTTSEDIALGRTTNKWSDVVTAKVNGLEPSALGMPDLANGIDISSYITVVANANKESLYTPPANGWICVRLSRTSGALGVLLIQGGMASSGKNIEVESGVTTADAVLPVVSGVQVSINSALADGIVSAYFYPCLGNV